MADGNLETVEKRISLLENLVFGTSEKDALYPKVWLQKLFHSIRLRQDIDEHDM